MVLESGLRLMKNIAYLNNNISLTYILKDHINRFKDYTIQYNCVVIKKVEI